MERTKKDAIYFIVEEQKLSYFDKKIELKAKNAFAFFLDSVKYENNVFFLPKNYEDILIEKVDFEIDTNVYDLWEWAKSNKKDVFNQLKFIRINEWRELEEEIQLIQTNLVFNLITSAINEAIGNGFIVEEEI